MSTAHSVWERWLNSTPPPKTQACGLQQQLNFAHNTSCSGHRSLWLICSDSGSYCVGHSRFRLSWRPAASYHFWSVRHRSSGTRLHMGYKYCWEILSQTPSCWCPHQYAINKWLIKLSKKNSLFYKHSKDKVCTTESRVNWLNLNLSPVTLVYNLLDNMVIVQWSTGKFIQFQEYDVLTNYM